MNRKNLPIGIKLTTDIFLYDIYSFIKDKEVHIWNEDTTIWNIKKICQQLKMYERTCLNNLYLHINNIDDLLIGDLSLINDSGVILSVEWDDKFYEFSYLKKLLSTYKLNITFNNISIEDSFNKCEYIKKFYNMTYDYGPGFTINIDSIKCGEKDSDIFINFMNSDYTIRNSIARHFLRSICNIKLIEDYYNIHNYKTCGYFLNKDYYYYYKDKIYKKTTYSNYEQFYKKNKKKYNKCFECDLNFVCHKYKSCKEIKIFLSKIYKYIIKYSSSV